MPKQVAPLSIGAPGFYGLNKQLAGSVLPPGWATELVNGVIDEAGRVTSRKGTVNVNSVAFLNQPKQIHEYTDSSGNSIVIFSTASGIFRIDGSSVTDITGSITAPTAGNWKFVNHNGTCVGVQTNHPLIQLTSVGGTFSDVVKSGTQQPTNTVNSAVSAFGRVWVIDGSDLKYSDLLDATAWNGVFDLSKYWNSGVDEGIAVTEFNGFLVVFGKNNIIVFTNPYDPASTMQIVENIGGIGCIARDSIQDIGTDMLFLSNSGIRSLGRTIQEKSMPVNDISKNVRDHLLSYVASEVKTDIKSVYSPLDGFYLLSLPSQNKSFWFDIRQALPDGSAKASEWDIAPTALSRNKVSTLYFGATGYISNYSGYRDGVLQDGTGGTSYVLTWEGGWTDFGDEVGPFIKIPKKLSVLMGGVAGKTVTAKWYVDYSLSYDTASITFPAGSVSRYGIAQYMLGMYSGTLLFWTAKSSLSKAGQVIKFGISSTVDGEKIILQRLDVIAKIGRISI